jgi:hypothetical protein
MPIGTTRLRKKLDGLVGVEWVFFTTIGKPAIAQEIVGSHPVEDCADKASSFKQAAVRFEGQIHTLPRRWVNSSQGVRSPLAGLSVTPLEQPAASHLCSWKPLVAHFRFESAQ